MSGGVAEGSDQRAIVTEADVAAAIDAAGLKPTAPLVAAVARHVRESLREALVMRAFAEVRAAARRRVG
jgi:hypothetical protein